MTLKFIPIDRSSGAAMRLPEMTLSELIRSGKTYDEYLQYQGFEATGGRPVYQGDVLELKITDELMDVTKDHFDDMLRLHAVHVVPDMRARPAVHGLLHEGRAFQVLRTETRSHHKGAHGLTLQQ